jgi:hypothetical protein
MKMLLFSSAILVFLTITGCKPEPDEELNQPSIKVNGTAKCNLDGAIWNGLASPIEASNTLGAAHRIGIFKTTAGIEFQFSGFKLEKGRYPIFPEGTNTAESVVTTSYQVGGYTYKLIELETLENYFEITSINWSRKEIEGRFQAAYEGIKPLNSPLDLPVIILPDSTLIDSLPTFFEFELPLDTIFVRNGSFKTFLVD